jgi:phosphoenolpyruvate---glycerone phosphotransferase subunit DhaL
MGWGTVELRAAITRIAAEMEAGQGRLNDIDGQIGDGDLGITLVKAFRRLNEIAPELPDDVGAALGQSGLAVMKVSSSSFGTLFASALMATGKQAKGRDRIEWSEIAGMLQTAAEAVARRGKAELGDKTVLDALTAAAATTSQASGPSEIGAAAERAGDEVLNDFRQRQSRIGRARIFGEKTIGVDDPGMVAFSLMVRAVVG